MKLIIFGATGMVGQGVLRECLADGEVDIVVAVGRSPTGQQHGKLIEATVPDLFDLSAVQAQLTNADGCLFCLGVSSTFMSEVQYRKLTFDLTISVAKTLAALNPKMTFVYVSGAGTDSTEKGRLMWARVKGATENALLAMPFAGAFMFRPAMIQPLNGAVSRTLAYRVSYAVLAPVMPLLQAWLPKYVTTTEQVARAMIDVVRHGNPVPILENHDIVTRGRLPPPTRTPRPPVACL